MANGGDPFIKKRLNQIREENRDLYDTGQFDLLLEKFNEGSNIRIGNVGLLQQAYNYYDQLPPPIDDSEKKNSKVTSFLDQDSLDLDSQSEEEDSSLDLFEKNKETTKLYLDYIADLESRGDYNAYQGSLVTGAPQYDFESMTLKGILDWQSTHGNKAVGRYQIKPETLKDMMKISGMSEEELYSPTNQDKLGLELLKRSGYRDYLEGKGYEDFALGLAKTWAAIPLVFEHKGKSPGESYYQGVGSNRAIGDAQELEKILRSNTAFSSKYTADFYDRANAQEMNELFSGITAEFIYDKSEVKFEEDFKKQYSRFDFDVKQSGFNKDEVIITHPAIEEPFTLNLENFRANVKNPVFPKAPNKEFMRVKSSELQDWMRGALNYVQPERIYGIQFENNPKNTLRQMQQDYLKEPFEIIDITEKLREKKELLSNTPKSITENVTFGYGPTGMTSRVNPLYSQIKNEINTLQNTLTKQQRDKNRLTREYQNLADNYGGLVKLAKESPYMDFVLRNGIDYGVLNAEHLKFESIKIDGRPSSLSELKKLTTDFDMIFAIRNGDVNIEVTEGTDSFEGTAMQGYEPYFAKQAAEMLKANTMGEGVGGMVEYYLRTTFPRLFASVPELTANAGDAVLDVGKIALDLAALVPDKYIADADKVHEYLDDKTAAHYDTIFDEFRTFAQNNIRSASPELSGSISDSESLGEFATKGANAAFESLLYIGLFMMNPAVGLTAIGLNAYGSSIDDAAQNQKLAEEFRQGGQAVPYSLDAYLDQSALSQRGVAVSKSALEVATTYAFTFKYFRDLTKTAKPGMTPRAFREAAREHRRNFVASYANVFGKALRTESLEESLISIENNAVDHIFGTREVSFRQYVDDARNAGLSSLFSSTALGAAGQHVKRSAAKEIVEGQIESTMLDRNTNFKQLQSNLAIVDGKIRTEIEKGITNVELLTQRNEILDEIKDLRVDLRDKLEGAQLHDLIKFADHEIEIAQILENVKSSGNEISIDEARASTLISEDDNRNPNIDNNIKARAEVRLKKLINSQQEIINKIDPKNQYKASIDTKNYLNSIIIKNGAQQEEDNDEIIYHSTVDIDGVLDENKLKTNRQAVEDNIETLPDTPDQEGGADAVFFTRDGDFDLSDRNGRFIFSRNNLSEKLTSGQNKKEFELKSDGEVTLSQENGLVGIEIIEGKDISDEVFGEPFIKGKEPQITEEQRKKQIIDLDKENAENYFKNRKKILQRAQKAADKYGVPVVITQHRGNYKMTEAAGHKTYMQDEVVYPKNATEQDYARFGTVIENQVRQRPAKTEQDQKYRNAAEILVNLRNMAAGRISFAEGGVDFTPYQRETFFARRPQEAQNLIKYLRNVVEDDFQKNSEQKKLLDELITKLSEVKSYDDLNKIALGRYSNELFGSYDINSQIFMATPSEFIGKRTSPQTVIESLFTSENSLFGFADIRHVLGMMFKNSNMKMPLLELNNNIDVRIQQEIDRAYDLKRSYENLEFLDNDPKIKKKPKRKEYVNDENQIERRILSHLGKYEIKNLEGEKLIESRQEQFLQKRDSYQNMIDNMADENSPKKMKEDQKMTQEVFDRLMEGVNDYTALESNAKPFNVAGVNYLRSLFQEDVGKVADHMMSFYGRKATIFGNYLPTITKGVKGAMSQIGTESDIEVIGMSQQFQRTPGNLKQSGPQTGEYSGGLSFENYDQVVLDHLTATRMQLANMADIYKMKGVFESKDFENLFEQGESFGDLKNFLLQILAQKVDRMNRVSANEKVAASAGANFRRVGNSLLRLTSVRRLGQLFMRAKQYYSATAAQTVNLGTRAGSFLVEQMALFSGGMNTRVQKNAKFRNALLSASLTKGRTGLSKTGMEPLYDLKYEKFDTTAGRAVQSVMNGLDAVSDQILKVTLTSTDALAAQNTFLAFYMDYVMKRNPDLTKMSNDEFFEYAANNIDTKAVAYADDQVARSQTQSDEWNSRGIYGQGNSVNKRILANTLFTFGRFQNNRKVGIANDISILSSDIASPSDKAQAQRRLASATIEIGVFKILSPMIGIGFAQSLMPFFQGILGFDEEVDKAAKMMMAKYGQQGDDKVRESLEFSLSNYERSITKEFATDFIQNIIPVPTPSSAMEFGFSALNGLLEDFGVDGPFNVYSPYARGLFDNTSQAVTESEIINAIYAGAGLYQMAGEDMYNLFSDIRYLTTAKYPPYMFGGKDRYVKDFGTKAADLLAYTTMLNFLVPSADLNAFNRLLRGKIKRDYLTTRPSQRALKKKYQEQQEKLEKLKQRQEKRKTSTKLYEKSESLKEQYLLRRSLQEALERD